MSGMYEGAKPRYLKINGVWYVAKEYMAHQLDIAISSAYKDGINHQRRTRNERIVTLVKEGGFSYREAAQVCGVSLKTVSGVMGKAKRAAPETLEALS